MRFSISSQIHTKFLTIFFVTYESMTMMICLALNLLMKTSELFLIISAENLLLK